MDYRSILPQDGITFSLDLGKVGLKKNADGTFLWELAPEVESETIAFPLDQLAIPLHLFDEIRILARNLHGVSTFSVKVSHFPSRDQFRSWYSKMALPERRLLDLRFDLKKNDDGWSFDPHVQTVQSANKKPEEQSDCSGDKAESFLEVSMGKIFRRAPGEPADRICQIESIQLVRRSVDLVFDEMKAELLEEPDQYKWCYYLEIQNRRTESQTVDLVLESADLHAFSADWVKKTLELAPRELRTIPFILSISKEDAARCPALYSERVLPKLYCGTQPVIFPLMGYRPRYVWATVPPKAKTFQLSVPRNDAERRKLLDDAEKFLEKPFFLPPQRYAEYCIIFKPAEMEALSFVRFRDRKTGEDISKKDGVAGSYIYHHNESTFRGMKVLAQAYILTGDTVYAEKIRDILLEYVRNFRYLVARDPDSTSACSRLTSTTLDLSYFFLFGVEAYAAVKESGVFGTADCHRIENEFFTELMGNLYSHNIRFSNMQLHHIANYGGAALLLGLHWNLLGEALYGDHGFYAFAGNGFTADGMALEAGVYHPFGFLPLLDFAARVRNCGIEIISEEFRKIFDYGIHATAYGISEPELRETYELGYRLFQNPEYLPTLKAIGKLPDGISAEDVSDTLFLGNTHLKHNGYLFLREKSSYGFRALAVNYLMQWDRSEFDRLHYRLFDDSGMISHEVGRVGYTNPGADMEATVSHNTIVIDERNSMPNGSELADFLDRDVMPGALLTEKKESPLYENSDFSKALAVFDGICFVGDLVHCKDGASHKFDWPFYAPWNEKAAPGIWNFQTKQEFQTPFEHNYSYVQEALSAQVKDFFTAQVPIPPSTPVDGFDILSAPDRTLRICVALPFDTIAVKFQIGRGRKPQPGPMLLLRQTGSEASFGAAFEVVKPGREPRIRRVVSHPIISADPLSAVWKIECTDFVYMTAVNRSGECVKYNGLSFAPGLTVLKM